MVKVEQRKVDEYVGGSVVDGDGDGSEGGTRTSQG